MIFRNDVDKREKPKTALKDDKILEEKPLMKSFSFHLLILQKSRHAILPVMSYDCKCLIPPL